MSSHIMVDIETMDTAVSAAIVSIGACAFDMHNPDEQIDRTFSATISLKSNQDLGRTISAGTVEWWLKQSPEAQASLFREPIMQLKHALTEFRIWVDGIQPRASRVWAKDPDFDCVRLGDAFAQLNMPWPFKYWESRSVRTIIEVAYPNGDEPNITHGVAHDAADDAVRQALMVRHCWWKLVHGK